MRVLRPIFYDQLSHSLASLQDIAAQDMILFCEVMEEATYVKHHPKKIALWFASMRHFAKELQDKGCAVRYITLDDPHNTGNITGEVGRALQELAINQIVVTEPSEYRLVQTVHKWRNELQVEVEERTDNRFLCTRQEFAIWAKNKKQLRMEYFYREMRKKYRILLTPDGQPSGGQWNYDQENRKPPKEGMRSIKRLSHKRSKVLQEVLQLVAGYFAAHFGDLEPFYYATTRSEALLELDHFIECILPFFGDHQDAMVKNEAYLNHSLLSSYINIGLLLPLEICQRAEQAYRQGKAPLNAVEGFIRQILGWREFIRGIYWLKMPEYGTLNYFAAKQPLPDFYWGANTYMACIKEAVSHTKIHAYSHHIQRLMLTGNFAMLAGLDVKQVQDWYLAVYSDAYEWVEMPNTLGMALFGDGGIVGSKPYAASGQYIHKMSNFCQSCRYKVTDMLGKDACPFNALYWDFLQRNRDKLYNNPRLAFMYKTWDKFPEAKKQGITNKAIEIIDKMQMGVL